MTLHAEINRTNPDFVVFVPPEDTNNVNRHNMHLIVAALANDSFLATWTQATEPHGPDQRIVCARSVDGGRTWSAPAVIDEPESGTDNIASWSVLVPIRDSNRVFCLYHKNIGVTDYDRAMTGVLAWRCSEDGGHTWGKHFQTPIGRSVIDHGDPNIPSNWVTAGWQLPIVTDRGAIIPITRWASRERGFNADFACQHHEGWFLRIDNIFTEPDPGQLTVTTLPYGDQGIRIPMPENPAASAAMEPALQELADGRLICLLRTALGCIYYSVSSDGAATWSKPQELCFQPGGLTIPHPNAPIGFGRMSDGRFLIFFHNNDGTSRGCDGPLDWRSRRPVYISVGKEIGNPGDQPIAFGQPTLFYDNGGPERPFAGSLALYGTFFENNDLRYWWYPDAIRFMLGRTIPDELLND